MRNALVAMFLTCLLVPGARAQQQTVSAAELDAFVGGYVLSDGSALTITRQRRTLIAQRDGQDAVRLMPSGPASFADRGGSLRIDFDQRANGNVAGLTLTVPVRR